MTDVGLFYLAEYKIGDIPNIRKNEDHSFGSSNSMSYPELGKWEKEDRRKECNEEINLHWAFKNKGMNNWWKSNDNENIQDIWTNDIPDSNTRSFF